MELDHELAGNLHAVRVRLHVRREHAQHAPLAVGLEIGTRHELVTEEERQHVVAVHTLRGGHVDLHAVVETEEPAHPAPVPDQRVEWRQERTRADRTRDRHAGQRVADVAPAVDRHGVQPTVVDQLGEERRYAANGLATALQRLAVHEPIEREVVGEVRGGRDAQGARREHQQLSAGIVAVDRRRVEHGGGDHAARSGRNAARCRVDPRPRADPRVAAT